MEIGNLQEPIVEARAVEKFYTLPDGHRIEVIAPTDLAVYPGSIVVLLGPSGSGKSTLLRMLTGLAQPSAGRMLWHGRPLNGYVPNLAVVFQSFALFPWLTVLQNVEAPLRAMSIGAIERGKRALRILDTVGLDGFETAYPKELSGGHEDLFRLAEDLLMEVDDLLPIIEAARQLRFINLQEGDAEITVEGRAFAEADILMRKVLFRRATLEHIPLLRQIEHALRAKSDRALPDDFFRDILSEHFSEDEAQRQLKTAIHWGRYAEIFDYDADSGRLFLTEE